MISALVMAAGASRRMGHHNKLLLPVDDELIVRRSVRTVLASKVSEVIVVTGHDAAKVQQALAGLSIKIVHNPDYTQGLPFSVASGVRYAAAWTSAFMICLADLPLLTPQDINALITTFGAQQQIDARAIVRPSYRGTPGHPVLWPACYRDPLCSPTGNQRPIDRFAHKVSMVPVRSDRYIRDIDTKKDFATFA